MSKPLVSAIIPAYNPEKKWLEEAIESVYNQSYENMELILVDDGSEAPVRDVLSEQLKEDMKIVRQANKGISGARNRGVKEAEGKYISILDQDDIWYPEKIEKQVEYLESHPEKGIVLTNFEDINAEGEKIGERKFNHNLEEMEGEELVSYFFNKSWKYDHPALPLTSSMIRRKLFDKFGYYDSQIKGANDREFMMRTFQEYGIKVLRENLMGKRSHGENVSGNWRTMLQDSKLITEKMIENYPYLEKYRPQREAHTELSKTYSLLGEGKIVPASVAWMKALHRSPSLTLSKTFNYVRKKF